MPSFGPVAARPVGSAKSTVGRYVEKLTATAVLGADYNAYGVVHKMTVTAVLGADYNAYGQVAKLSVTAVLGNDPHVPGTVNKSTVAVVLAPVTYGLDQSALHVVTGGTSGYGLLEQAALHAVVIPASDARPVIISINT